MSTIEIKLDINDSVFTIDGKTYDREKRQYVEFEVNEYKIKSISISCNSKKEWKISYRVQLYNKGKTVDFGFNFKENSIGKCVFLTKEEAENKMQEIYNMENE